MYKTGLFLILFFVFTGFLNRTEDKLDKDELNPPFLCCDTSWADSTFNSLSNDERIAQLFMVAAYSNKEQEHVNKISQLIKKYKIGGLIFFQGGPIRQARLTNYYQNLANVPLMISIDGEWGLGMRLDSTISFPYQMALGAIENDRLIYNMGAEIARQCKLMGIHVNLAPVIDINNNPKNPVINYRSFGEDRDNVAKKGIAYSLGMQDNGILANAKHFPGHGDTDTDSHVALPIIKHNRDRLDSLELYPFNELIKKGLGSIMVAHLYIPSLEKEKNTATTLSKNTVTQVLKKEMDFKGLIFTDALNMKGVSNYYPPGIVDVKALLAGNDVLLFSEDVPKAISEIKKAIKKGEITQHEIDIRCKKILKAKEWMQLSNYQPIDETDLIDKLNSKKAEILRQKLIENSLTLTINKNNILPLSNIDSVKIATLSIGSTDITSFQKVLNSYSPMEHFNLSSNPTPDEIGKTMFSLSKYDIVLASIHSNTNRPSRNFGISNQCNEMINHLVRKKKTILSVFANPYGLQNIKELLNVQSLIIAYGNGKIEQEKAGQLIFGGIKANGHLPVSISKNLPVGTGITTSASYRFNYGLPEEMGMNSNVLDSIDTLVQQIIIDEVTPGCQIFIARKGTIVYNKSFGYHTYNKKQKVKNTNLYDLASLTKILSSTSILMKLEHEGKFSLDSTLGYYLPEIDTSEISNLTSKEILSHQAGLKSWIAFWLETVENVNFNKAKQKVEGSSIYKPHIYSDKKTDTFSYKVAEGLYSSPTYSDSIFERILKEPLRENRKYHYSDLGYYLLKRIIERITKEDLNSYTKNNFYKPLGLTTMCYLPKLKVDDSEIVPTEDDKVFRKQLLRGDVHDPGAALLNGIGGHAGLFSNATDVGVFMQMLLNNGHYGGTTFLDSALIKAYTKCQFCDGENRRGAGFDRPELDYHKPGPTCKCISGKSFGHTGFTGTMAWADPAEEIVYVFLSNRIHPDAKNRKLIKMNIRTKIQEFIYNSIIKES